MDMAINSEAKKINSERKKKAVLGNRLKSQGMSWHFTFLIL